jgi:hypothetical protein
MSRGTILEIDHKCHTQADRLRPALEARNARMMGPGQEQWNHGCDKCTHVLQSEGGERRKSITHCPFRVSNLIL